MYQGLSRESHKLLPRHPALFKILLIISIILTTRATDNVLYWSLLHKSFFFYNGVFALLLTSVLRTFSHLAYQKGHHRDANQEFKRGRHYFQRFLKFKRKKY